jgi:two-component system, LytTR family, response regulator
MIFKALIIDDEDLARDLIRDYLKKIPEIAIAGEFADGFSGLKGIQEMKPDIVFLDVQMPKLTGFELLELIDDPPEIIFTTAFDRYAINAFEHNAVDYLLKPFSEDRFREAASKAMDRIKGLTRNSFTDFKKHMEDKPEVIFRVAVKTRNEIKVIPVEEIIYLEAQDDYVMLYTPSGKFLKQKTLKYFEEHLERDMFIRVHRSFLVKADQILKLEPYGKDSWVAVLRNAQHVPVSRSGYREVRKVFDI